MKICPLVVVALLAMTTTVHSAKILALFQFPGRSHFVMFEALLKSLAERGHQVSVLSHWPQSKKVPNYTDISLVGSMPTFFNSFTMDFVRTLDFTGLLDFLWPGNVEICRIILEHPEVKKLIDSDEKYDLIVTEVFSVDCFLGFAAKKQIPFISMTSSVIHPWTNSRFGNPDNPAYIPNYFLPYTQTMTFTERVWNVVYGLTLDVAGYFYRDIPLQKLSRKHFGEDLPPLSEIAKNTSLIFVNSHFSLNQPRPMVPAVIEVGGLHIPAPKKLPQDLQTFLDASPEGVIYFSMGSLVRTDSFSPDKLSAIIEAFGLLKIKVLWKINPETLPKLPDNVRVEKWVPQTDVLNHPNIRLFITHGGLMGTQEAVYAGVPLVGIPLFADQLMNIQTYVSEGLAVKLEYQDITLDTMFNSINHVLNEPRFKKNAERLSTLFRDRPHTAMETAIYWTEYVIKHQGAHHLRSRAVDLPFHQYLLLDVIAALSVAAILVVTVIWLIIKILLALCRNKKSKAKRKTQ